MHEPRSRLPLKITLLAMVGVPSTDGPIIPSSHMLRAPNHLAPHLRPINTVIQLLVHQPADNHIVPSDHVQAMCLLDRSLLVVLRPDNPLDRVLQHEIRDLIAGDQGAGEGASVDGQDDDFFCEGGKGFNTRFSL